MLFYRELSYAHTVLGESYQTSNQLDLAEIQYTNSLNISKEIANLSPQSASLKNDLAIDIINFASLLKQNNKIDEAKKYWQQAEEIIEKIAQRENASLYYINTYAYTLLIQGKFVEAKPYLDRLKNSEGWPHASYLEFVKEYNL